MKHYFDVVQTPTGAVVPGAQVDIFNTGTTVHANIFSDDGLTPSANPLFTNSLGRFDFFVADGVYDIQVSGVNISTPIMQLRVEIADLTEANVADADWLTQQLNFLEQPTPPSPTAGQLALYAKAGDHLFVKNSLGVETDLLAAQVLPPVPVSAVRYVAHNGLDTNDGLSWFTPKKTIYAALQALPGGSASPPTAGAGQLFITDGGGACGGSANWVQAGLVNPLSAAGTGIWVMGSQDPNFANPPTGWLRYGGPVRFTGVGGTCNPAQNVGAPMVDIGAGAVGGFMNSGHPAVWLSAISGYTFENLAFVASWNVFDFAHDSNGAQVTAHGVSNIRIDHCSGGPNNFNAGSGPSVNIAGNALWLWFEHCTFSANTLATSTADNRANMLITAGANSGLHYVLNSTWNGGGGIKIHGAGNPYGIVVENLTIEGQDPAPPAVWWADTQHNISTVAIVCNNVGTADDTAVGLEIDAILSAGQVSANNTTVIGPATNFGINGSQAVSMQTKSPAYYTQAGVFSSNGPGRLYGQQDTLRRGFSPVLNRFINLAPQLPSGWVAPGSVVITPGKPAPDGSTNAGRVSGAGPANGFFFYTGTRTISVGDWLIGGFWARRQSGIANTSPVGYFLITNGILQWSGSIADNTGLISIPNFINGDGEWQWYGQSVKIFSTTSGTGTVSFLGTATAATSYDFFAPVFLHLPVGTVTDNEAAELGTHLASYPEIDNATDIATLRGHTLVSDNFRSRGTTFVNLGNVINGEIIYCSDCTITSPCNSGGTGAFAKGLGGIWVCN